MLHHNTIIKCNLSPCASLDAYGCGFQELVNVICQLIWAASFCQNFVITMQVGSLLIKQLKMYLHLPAMTALTGHFIRHTCTNRAALPWVLLLQPFNFSAFVQVYIITFPVSVYSALLISITMIMGNYLIYRGTAGLVLSVNHLPRSFNSHIISWLFNKNKKQTVTMRNRRDGGADLPV